MTKATKHTTQGIFNRLWKRIWFPRNTLNLGKISINTERRQMMLRAERGV